KALANNGSVFRAAAACAAGCAADAALRDSAAILGAAIALAEFAERSDDDLAAAIAAGRELQARIHRSVGAAAFDAIWHARSTVGIFGAVAAAVSLMKLDAVQARNALGLAATQSAGVAATTGTAAATIAVGKAAADAVEAAILASHGFTSSAAPIEGRRAFAALMAPSFDAPAITDGLGTNWSAR